MATVMTPTMIAAATPAILSPALLQVMNNQKDSRWLTLEVCREFLRGNCSRSTDECKYAHPPDGVEIQNGRVMCCFDSIKGKCQRTDPPCKYLHPPAHLKEKLVENGRNNLMQKAQMQATLSQFILSHGMIPPNSGQPITYLDPNVQQFSCPAVTTAAVHPSVITANAVLGSPFMQTGPYLASPMSNHLGSTMALNSQQQLSLLSQNAVMGTAQSMPMVGQSGLLSCENGILGQPQATSLAMDIASGLSGSPYTIISGAPLGVPVGRPSRPDRLNSRNSDTNESPMRSDTPLSSVSASQNGVNGAPEAHYSQRAQQAPNPSAMPFFPHSPHLSPGCYPNVTAPMPLHIPGAMIALPAPFHPQYSPVGGPAYYYQAGA